MNKLLMAIILLLLALAGIVVRKTYYYLPAREMKRRAGKGDVLAISLYRAVAYGNSLSVLLWLFIGFTTAGGLVLLVKQLSILPALVLVAVLLWIGFSLVPATRITKIGVWLTKIVTPAIAWLLNFLHPLLSRGAVAVETRYIAGAHTKLFEREDLVELVERQKFQEDNRLSEEELDIVRRALSFDEFKVRDVLTPRKLVKTILTSENIGPVLIDDLHKSGQSYVLVKDKAKGQVVGTLAFDQLGLNSKGRVGEVMNNTVYYLHESDSLSEALHAFFITNHPMFIVVNSFEEFVGIITVENVIKQLMGHVPGDDFDQYADPAAVAARHPNVSEVEVVKQDELKSQEEAGPKS